MLTEKGRSAPGFRARRKQTIHTAVKAALGLLIFAVLVMGVYFWQNLGGYSKKDLQRLWEEGFYQEAFEISGNILQKRPMDFFLLSLNGFAAYQLGIAQINNADALNYIDRCIWSLRRALLTREGASEGRIAYVLGKAYYGKGPFYADMAVKYLEAARDHSYRASDIPEYLGLAYADLRDYRSSVAAFAVSLQSGADSSEGTASPGAAPDRSAYPSDQLLLAIARSYMELGEGDTAMAYAMRAMETSRDAQVVLAARLRLGSILAASGDRDGAKAQYNKVIEETGADAEDGGLNEAVKKSAAEAHFQLGELSFLENPVSQNALARAEWRKALKLNPNHEGARKRMNI